MNGPLQNPTGPLGTLELLVPLLAPALGALVSWLLLGRQRFLRHGLIWGLALWGLALPLWVVFAGLMPHWGRDPLRSFPWHAAVAMFCAAFLSTSLILFLAGRLVGKGKHHVWLSLSLALWGLVLGVLGACSRMDLATGLDWTGSSPAMGQELQVWFLDEDNLMAWTPEGGRKRMLGGLQVDSDARLVAHRGARGWDLSWVSRRGEGRLLEGFLPQDLELTHPEARPWVRPFPSHLGKAMPSAQVRPREDGVEEAMRVAAGASSVWRVELGTWPRQGLSVHSQETGLSWKLALDAPLWSAAPRCGSLLPGGRLLFQLGNHLYLTELDTRKILALGRGRGPLGVGFSAR